jgi:hypothetical protein
LPPYRTRVRDGENGFRCRGADDWKAALNGLVESASLRQQIRSAAQRDVQWAWKSTPDSPNWMTVLESAPSTVRRGHREAIGVVMDQLVAYQTDLQRQIKRTAGYQVRQMFRRFAKLIA